MKKIEYILFATLLLFKSMVVGVMPIILSIAIIVLNNNNNFPLSILTKEHYIMMSIISVFMIVIVLGFKLITYLSKQFYNNEDLKTFNTFFNIKNIAIILSFQTIIMLLATIHNKEDMIFIILNVIFGLVFVLNTLGVLVLVLYKDKSLFYYFKKLIIGSGN